MNFVQVIKQCEEANGAGSKKVIQAALKTADRDAQLLIIAALNPYSVYGVKQFDMPAHDAPVELGKSAEDFLALLIKLADKTITGNAAREAVTATLAKYDSETASYLARVIDKDLRAGFSAESANKAWEKDLIPVYACQLADKCEDTDDFEQYVKFPCQADFKYDGERTQAFVTETEIVYRSRSGKEAVHVAGLFDTELFQIRSDLGYDFVLDGERCSDLGFTDTVNAKKAGNDKAKENLRFRAFFLMPMSDWLAQRTSITTRQNRAALIDLIERLNLKKVILTEGREVKDYQDMMAFCNEAIDKPENAARKIEGLILKDWDATYQWDRTFAWTKVKRFYDVDCRVVGFYNGRAKSRLEKTLGGIKVVGFLEDGTRVETNVGSGFSDALRNEIWNNQEEWLKKTVVIKYQEVSKAKGKEHASLRFPTFERDRDDKLVEV